MSQNKLEDTTLLLFSTPVFIYNEYSTISDIHDTASEQLDTRINTGENLTSNENYVLDLESYSVIRDRIMSGLNEYVNNILCTSPEHEFYLTQSWLNFNPPGSKHHRHHHANSIISGVYYIDTVETDEIKFVSNTINTTVTNNSTLEIDVVNYNMANSNAWSVPVNRNSIIYFPSTTSHEVSPNNSDKTRISLSFNVFVRGTFGSSSALNELKL